MPRIKRVQIPTGAQQLRNENIPLTSSSPSRRRGSASPSRSPGRVKLASPSRVAQQLRNEMRQEDMEFEEAQNHSPPKQRRHEAPNFGAPSSSIGRRLDFSSKQDAGEDVNMEEDRQQLPTLVQDDLSVRITNMIVSQCGGFRKRKHDNKEKDEEAFDEEMDEDCFGSGPQAKRSPFAFVDYDKLIEEMDQEDAAKMEECLPKARDYFEQWKTIFSTKMFSVLVTGRGSKMAIINKFIEECWEEDRNHFPAIVISGNNAAVSTKDIFRIIEANLKIKLPAKREMNLVQYARELGEAVTAQKREVLLVIHSLDGKNLR